MSAGGGDVWRKFAQPLWALVWIAAAAGIASAQQARTISGSVTTRADGLAIPGAVVSVVGTDVTTATDASGRYTLQDFGVSTGSFAGNRCTPDGLSCSPGDDISFSDGGLGDIAGSWGIGIGKGSLTLAAEYRASQSHEPGLIRSARPTRAGRRGHQSCGDSRTTAGVIPIRATPWCS
jgi:hypothetical protein